MKFVLLVEGSTERESVAQFIKRWLDPQLPQPVGIRPIPFKGYSDFDRSVAMKARDLLEGPRNDEIIAVCGLLDLYGPDFYRKDLKTTKERWSWAVDRFEKRVKNPRFRMFFAVHEYEAWLLSQPKIFPTGISSRLEKIVHPEQVNFEEPPAKLLDSLFQKHRKRSYRKTIDGPGLFKKLDPAVAIDRCPHLKAMLEEMLKMARGHPARSDAT